MPTWTPGMPWPSGATGGASSPYWSGYVRLWLRAGLAPGTSFHMGTHPNDRLDAGNVLGSGGPAGRAVSGDRLWVDLSCDVLDLEIAGGASSSDGIFSKAEAATLVATLSDPEGIYDPFSTTSPFSYGGHSRLVPGTPVEAYAEVVNGDDGTWARYWLFTGTADQWGEEWTPHASKRRAKLVASDVVKQWARYNRAEQPEAGAGDTTAQRVQRLVTYFDWPGVIDAPAAAPVATLQGTTLAQTGWELLNRALDDELGYVYFTAEGELRWLARADWLEVPPPVLELGCPDLAGGAALRDVLVEAKPATLDRQLRNGVYAARTGGATQVAISDSSRARYGEYDYKRTDLGLQTDIQVATWTNAVLVLYAYPQQALENVTLRPELDPHPWEVWAPVLALELVTDLVRIRWAPPDLPLNEVDVTSRVVGYAHRVTRRSWEVEWQLVGAGTLAFSGAAFTMGPDAADRLDAGYVLG